MNMSQEVKIRVAASTRANLKMRGGKGESYNAIILRHLNLWDLVRMVLESDQAEDLYARARGERT